MHKLIELQRKYSLHKMEVDEIVDSFDCGDADLNDFILNNAPDFRRAMLAITYALLDNEDPDRVVAYCSLAYDRVSITDFESKTEFNRFRKHQGFPQSKRLKSYPAVKICRLGVDLSVRGQAIGTYLLHMFKSLFSENNNKAACRFVLVDAYTNAIPFYQKNGFKFLSSEEEDAVHTRLMYFDLMNIVGSAD